MGHSFDDISHLRNAAHSAAQAGETERAIANWKLVLEAHPDDAEALFCLGTLAHRTGDIAQAIEHLEHARRLAPLNVAVLNNLGLAVEAAQRIGDAEVHFRIALSQNVQSFEAIANLAQNLYRQNRHEEALSYYDLLIAQFDVAHPAIWANRGVCLRTRGRLADAVTCYARAIELSASAPAPTLLLEYALLQLEVKDFDAAERSFEEYLALSPDSLEGLAGLLFARQNLAKWHGLDRLVQAVLLRVRTNDPSSRDAMSPFHLLTICDDAQLACSVAREWARKRVRGGDSNVTMRRHFPLRLGFVSHDLYDHPVGRLIVELVELIDRRRFHVTLFAVGPAHNDKVTRRLATAADAFVVSGRADAIGLGETIRGAEIDVLFDLGGYTGISPVDAIAQRPAPVQAVFLGFTGTMGSSAYDFIVADRYCIEQSMQEHYSEEPLYVDPCYLPSDSQRLLVAPPSRNEYGLAQDAIVLCALAPTYKILPTVFDSWMTLLSRHPRAMLWLRDAGTAVNDRIREWAAARGVGSGRLAFAPFESTPRYLARFPLSNLFVDTVPFGSHTTVNDALFAGVPVVTLEGQTFAARASASQVRAVGLSQLVARTLDEYVATIDRLLSSEGELAVVSQRLIAGAHHNPLFDMRRYTRAFEDAVEEAVGSRW